MSSKDQPTQSDIQPEGGRRVGPFTEPAPDDTEGHFGRKGFIDDTDVEGHILTRPGPCRSSMSVSTRGRPTLAPFTEPAPDDTEGHFIRKGGCVDETDVEGHVLTSAGTPGRSSWSTATRGRQGYPFLNATQSGIEPENGRRPAP